ncbi:kelch repeat and BTB domain-containing protein 4 [Plakobranchus ocellatus]|uniref:Kelch repeat and BTB domain-containing protein 4 n=1 Tax=Plakobranchus ocellatus TaxID=259542 RepID=A0AAV4D300_9GAST|nr:kelch repeat and BTB domain-containing protein 4 [Plakobranchus ocellatus]
MAAIEETAFHGTWKITECVSVSGVVEITGIEGTEFILDENGDVIWELKEEAETLPLFNCETYKVLSAAGQLPMVLKFIGNYGGHIVEFTADFSDNHMFLSYENCCMLQCKKISPGVPQQDSPFHFLSALEYGYFSDTTLRSDTKKEFKVHSIILGLSAPSLDWTGPVPPLTGLPEDVLQTTLHFLYAECLPRGLTEATARQCVKMVGKLPGFSKFGQLCETFLKNTALTQQMKTLVSEIHACADRINDLFGGPMTEERKEAVAEEGSMCSNPAKLCYTIRQALREEAIGCAKFVIMCDLFSKRKYELSKEERHDIMKYVKSRVPVFLNQMIMLETTVMTHLQSLTLSQRADIAAYFVPEIETILHTMSRFTLEAKSALEQAIFSSHEKVNSDKTEKSEKHKWGIGDSLGRTLKHALHLKELKKLKHFHEKTSACFMDLKKERSHFIVKSQADKVRSVSHSLRHLVDLVPVHIVRLRKLKTALDEKVTWKEWKYIFKMATSKVSWGLSKVQSNRESLQPMINEMCEIVRSEQFNSSLVTLGLVDPGGSPASAASSSPAPAISSTNTGTGTTTVPGPIPSKESTFSAVASSGSTKYAQLSCVESLCVSPSANNSSSAKRCLELFRTATNTDMVFEVINPPDIDGGDIIIDHTLGQETGETAGAVGGQSSGGTTSTVEEEMEVEVQEIRAHRVIVAARCDWFRRALLSGMKEAIDRKIVVHDTNPDLFRRFLEALYAGHLDTSDLNDEQLADMMTLCDRYEMDNLKLLCEHKLKSHLNEDNALYLLNLADHLNSRGLKDAALSFISKHRDLTGSEVYQELPDHLKDEVLEAIVWHGLDIGSPLGRDPQQRTLSSSSSLSEVDDLVLVQDRALEMSSSSSSDELPFVGDAAQLNSCIQELSIIVGDDVPREELARIALAADYDVNRALNFFYST